MLTLQRVIGGSLLRAAILPARHLSGSAGAAKPLRPRLVVFFPLRAPRRSLLKSSRGELVFLTLLTLNWLVLADL